MELKLEDLTLEQLKEVSTAIDAEIHERKSKIQSEHIKDLINALSMCLSEGNSYISGYVYPYSNEYGADVELEIEEILQTVLDALKDETIN